MQKATEAKEKTEEATKNEQKDLAELEDVIYESQTGVVVEKVQDTNAGVLEISETDENVLIINSIEDLVFFAYDVKQGNTYEGKTVELGISLDFKSNKSYIDASRTDYAKYGYNGLLKTALTTGEGFKGIGTTSNIDVNLYSFKGTFDGKNNQIINLYMNRTKDAEEEMRLAFFGNNNGIIKNLKITNANISLTTTGSTGDVAGIASKNYNTIENCGYEGKVSIDTKNAVTGAIRIGGLVTGNENGATITNCYHNGNIIAKNTSNTENTTLRVGGISSANSGTISQCYSSGEIVANNMKFIGGITGYNNGQIINCYNSKNILVGNATHIGGITGTSQKNQDEIINCYNIGSISGENLGYTGNIVGLARGIINNCYYLKKDSISGIGIIANNSSITDYNIGEKSEAEMKSDTFVSVLNDSNNIWKKDTNNINNGYPILNWQ